MLDRSGQGLGLAFSRWGAEANHGRISARNHAEGGCVFTIDLPHIDLSPIEPLVETFSAGRPLMAGWD